MTNKAKGWIQGLFFLAVLIFLDQITKQLAVKYLADGPIVLWDGVFELRYTTNTGAAFGLFKDQRISFLISAVITTGILVYLYLKMPVNKRYLPLRITCLALLAGALGNMLDRLFVGYVHDFLYFSLINFPIFNVADCYVTISLCITFYLIMFHYKEEELHCLLPFRKSKLQE